jgi:hypothetical protein
MFQIHVLAAPAGTLASSTQDVRLAQWSALDIGQSLMTVTFEELALRLQAFERMHFEMDGSFVWTGCAPGAETQSWQLDGMVYDLRQHVQRIELKGYCLQPEWQRFLSAIDYPAQPLVAYDLQSGQFATMQNLESRLWRP